MKQRNSKRLDGAAARSVRYPFPIAPELMTLAVAGAMFGFSRSCLYRLAGSGLIKIVKNGRQSLVAAADLRAYAASLPPAQIGRGV